MSGPRLFDRVRDVTTTTGTGTVTLANSAPTGFRTFGSVLSNGDTASYCIELNSEWEVGIGTYSTTGPTLARTTVLASSNSGSAVNFSAGTKNVFLCDPAGFADLSALTEVSVPALTDVLPVAISGIPGKETLTRTLGLAGVTPGGRLTLTTGVPVTSTDVTGATSIYYTPQTSDYVRLYDGTRVREYTFSELTLALGTKFNAQGYDVFIYDNSGTLTLEVLEWSNATVTMTIASPCVVTWTGHGLSTGDSITFTTTGALPTGLTAGTQYWITKINANTFNVSTTLANVAAGTLINTSGSQSGTHTAHAPRNRQTALAWQTGLGWVKSGDATRLHLGSFMTTSTTTTEDSEAKRFLWNRYNQEARSLLNLESTASWTLGASNNWTQRGTKQVEAFLGAPSLVTVDLQLWVVEPGGSGACAVAIGVDSANTAYGVAAQANVVASLMTALRQTAGIGHHVYTWLENCTGSTGTYDGSNTSPTRKSGLTGTVRG